MKKAAAAGAMKKAAAAGAMKKAAAAGAMKKAKRASKIAKGRFAKVLVFRGKKEKTVGGLTRDALTRNKRGKIVSKRASANGKRRFAQVEDWLEAVMDAREMLHTRGFVAINGKSLHGKALYIKAKALRAARRTGQAAASTGSAVGAQVLA